MTCAAAVRAALPFGLYVTTIVHALPEATVNPDTHVPPVTVKLLPAGPFVVTATVGVAVTVRGPGLGELALFVSVIVALCAVVAPVTSDWDGAEKLTVATVVEPVNATV